MKTTGAIIKEISYPGRGIVLGSKDGAVYAAYFISGRSENSRNRIFVKTTDGIKILPYDESKVADPSLIIYSPIRRYKNNLIVTNGDQTDTIYDWMASGHSFFDGLRTRTFEPDAPNFTPRISGIVDLTSGNYALSILKSAFGMGKTSERQLFEYETDGTGRLIHTYTGDGNPLPSFTGEPTAVSLIDNIDDFAADIWENLNSEHKISLYCVKFNRNGVEERLINKHGGKL